MRSDKAPSKEPGFSHKHEISRYSYPPKEPTAGDDLAYVTGGASAGSAKVFSAHDSNKVPGVIDSLDRKWWRAWRRGRDASGFRITRYYPYYFQAWKITAPKTFGRTVRVLLFTGVNGMSRSVGPATGWPDGEEREVSQAEIIPPQTSWAEAEQLSREYIEKFVMRRYRPVRSAGIVQENFGLVYVPYYVYAREGQPLKKASLIEASTGALGRVRDVPPILQSIVGQEIESAANGFEER